MSSLSNHSQEPLENQWLSIMVLKYDHTQNDHRMIIRKISVCRSLIGRNKVHLL